VYLPANPAREAITQNGFKHADNKNTMKKRIYRRIAGLEEPKMICPRIPQYLRCCKKKKKIVHQKIIRSQ
jgi:hypothetical protein